LAAIWSLMPNDTHVTVANYSYTGWAKCTPQTFVYICADYWPIFKIVFLVHSAEIFPLLLSRIHCVVTSGCKMQTCDI